MKSVQRVWRGSDSAYQSHDAGEGGESATLGSLKEPQGDLKVIYCCCYWKDGSSNKIEVHPGEYNYINHCAPNYKAANRA